MKSNKEVSFEYMKIFEREQMIREEGENKLGRLIYNLLREGLTDIATLVTQDKVEREKYYKKYGI